MCGQRQYIAEGPLFGVRIQTNNDQMFAEDVHRGLDEGNQASHEELGLVHDDRGGLFKLRPAEHVQQSCNTNGLGRNRD